MSCKWQWTFCDEVAPFLDLLSVWSLQIFTNFPKSTLFRSGSTNRHVLNLLISDENTWNYIIE